MTLSLISSVLAALGIGLLLSARRAVSESAVEMRVAEISRADSMIPQGRDWHRGPAILWNWILIRYIRRRMRMVEGAIRRVHMLSSFAGLLVAAGAAFWLWGAVVAVAVLALGLLFAVCLLDILARRSYDRFLSGYPGFLDRVRKLVEAGNSFGNALEKALSFAHPRVSQYISPAVNRHRLGMPLAAALEVQAERLGIPEISMLALVAHVSFRFGGNLGDILSHVATVERDRTRVKQELRALTAEVRSSTRVLLALPAVVASAIVLIQPGYVSYFIDDVVGRVLLAYCVLSAVVGLSVMHQMNRIDY